VTGRVSAGQRASVSNVYTGNYAYGQRGATYNPSTGVGARGGSATYGNADTGAQNTAKWGQVSGPHGQSTGVVQSGNNTYADHNGNVYKDTGSGWQKYDNGSWNNVEKPGTSTTAGSMTRPSTSTTDSLDAQKQARTAGDQRSASSSWGSKDWGGGFDHGDSGAVSRPSGGGGFGGGGDRNWASGGGGDRNWAGGGGGGGWDRGGDRSWAGGGGGWDRGGGGFGGGGRSWGGGGFGGFRGGGFRR
jgi:hypothetical protein